MHVVRLDGKADDLPAVLRYHIFDDLLQPVLHRVYQHLAAPFGAPDDVVYHQVDIVPFVLIVHGYGMSCFSSVRKSQGAIHPPVFSRGMNGPFL